MNDRSSTGPRTTPLVLAVDDGSADIVKILLEAGADPNIRYEVTAPQIMAHTTF